MMNKNLIFTLTVLLAAGLCLAAPGCPPRIDSIDPGAGSVGDLVQIIGEGFGEDQGGSTVDFSGTDAGVATSWSEAEIVVAVPDGAVSGPVVVVVEELASNGLSFQILDDCDTFGGGDFDFTVTGASDTCFDGLLSDLIEVALSQIDISVFNPVEVPSTAGLPLGFQMELPGTGLLTYTVDRGREHCWEGSWEEPHDPFLFDLGALTGGEIDCAVTISDVLFSLDSLAGGEVTLQLSMEVASMEGEFCTPNNTPGCTMSVQVGGQGATPEE